MNYRRFFREHWDVVVGATVVGFFLFFAFPALLGWSEQSSVDRAALAGFEHNK